MPKQVGDIAFVYSAPPRRLRVVSAVADESVSLFDFYEPVEFRMANVSRAH